MLWGFVTLRIARVVDVAGLFANETQACDESIEDVIAAVKQPLSNTPHSTVALVSRATTGNTAKCDSTVALVSRATTSNTAKCDEQ